jgi:hypothetical protein
MVLRQRQDVFRRQRHDRQNDHCSEHSVGVECAWGRGDQQANTLPGSEKLSNHGTDESESEADVQLARIQLMAAGITTVVVTCQREAPRISAFAIIARSASRTPWNALAA